MEKTCSVCNVSKTLDFFHKKPRSACKVCTNEKCKKYRKSNKEKVSKCTKQCRENNKEKYLETEKIYRENNQENIIKLRTENKEKYDISKRIYETKKYKNSPEYRVLKKSRDVIRRILNSDSKNNDFVSLIDCKPEFFRNWIQYNFDSFMNFDNYATYWNLDHVIPCSSFNLLDEEKKLKCFSWENTRPVICSRNNSKRNKVIQQEIVLQQLRVNHYKIMQQNQIAGNS